jgi:hypothetical protein
MRIGDVEKFPARHSARPSVANPLLHREQLARSTQGTQLFQITWQLFAFGHSTLR